MKYQSINKEFEFRIDFEGGQGLGMKFPDKLGKTDEDPDHFKRVVLKIMTLSSRTVAAEIDFNSETGIVNSGSLPNFKEITRRG